MTDVLGIGLTGPTLTDFERSILRDSSPFAIVLFGRNIESVEQLRELVAEVKSVSARAPLFMIDQEGGRVDRLRNILPGLPSAEALGEGERAGTLSGWLGKVTGMALRHFDIEIDLAPVLDIRGEVASKGLERRAFGRDPETVIELGGAFLRGLREEGVASCLKHWPGIGEGTGDSHYGPTVIDKPIEELAERELLPFARLGNEAGAILVGHGLYPRLDPAQPASLSRRLTTDLLRDGIGFQGLAITDDMEMHAVADLGPHEEIAERALMAGNDVLLFCSHIEKVPDLQSYIRRRVDGDAGVRARFVEAAERREAFRAYCERLRIASAPPTWDSVIAERDAFLDAFQRARTTGDAAAPEPEHGVGGRTGREEWT